MTDRPRQRRLGDPDSGQNWGAENRDGSSGANIATAGQRLGVLVHTSPPAAGGSVTIPFDITAPHVPLARGADLRHTSARRRSRYRSRSRRRHDDDTRPTGLVAVRHGSFGPRLPVGAVGRASAVYDSSPARSLSRRLRWAARGRCWLRGARLHDRLGDAADGRGSAASAGSAVGRDPAPLRRVASASSRSSFCGGSAGRAAPDRHRARRSPAASGRDRRAASTRRATKRICFVRSSRSPPARHRRQAASSRDCRDAHAHRDRGRRCVHTRDGGLLDRRA